MIQVNVSERLQILTCKLFLLEYFVACLQSTFVPIQKKYFFDLFPNGINHTPFVNATVMNIVLQGKGGVIKMYC